MWHMELVCVFHGRWKSAELSATWKFMHANRVLSHCLSAYEILVTEYLILRQLKKIEVVQQP
jgi:uncharacterized membrane protein YoaT (DUF817 family)